MSAPTLIHVVPAPAGTYAVYLADKEIIIGELVIAFRFDTYVQQRRTEEVYSECTPLCTTGQCSSNIIGIQLPDKSVDIFYICIYGSFEEAQLSYKAE